MSTLEQDIIDKFRQLEPEARQRVLQTLTDNAPRAFDYTSWWVEVENLQAEIRARLGETATVGTLAMLAELREESS